MNSINLNPLRPCPCGSGLESHWESDARGIPLARVCKSCFREKLSKYRPEVLTDPNYSANEDIEPDEWFSDLDPSSAAFYRFL